MGVACNRQIVSLFWWMTCLTDLWLSSIRVELQRKGPNYEAKAFVRIVGESFSLITEAIVTGS
jgi:hypothetical protein